MIALWAMPALGMPLERALDRALDDPALVGASYGVVVVDVGGEPMFARDAERRLVPASTTKWVTAAAVAQDLGLERRFHTSIAATGWSEGTTLHGDLVVVGSGDPSLGDPDPQQVLDQVVAIVREAGVERLDGRVLVDPTAVLGPPFGPGWMWDDLNQPYSPPYGAANFAHNVLAPGLDCEAQDGPGSPLVDPAQCLASSVRAGLLRAGVLVDGPAMVEAAPDAVEIGGIESPPLRDLVKHMLLVSDNLYAECLRRALDRVAPRESEVADERVAALLREAGVEDARLVDGSGLSRYSMLSADGLARVSVWVAAQPWGPELIALLPVAGREGTLQGRLVDTDGRVRAKTGSMNGVRNLVGFAQNTAGDPLVFAVLINGFLVPQAQAIAVQDRVVELIAASDRRGRVPRRTVAALGAPGG